ncbi:MAG: PAS domain S-box protein [Desulfatiglandaceae bacterium]
MAAFGSRRFSYKTRAIVLVSCLYLIALAVLIRIGLSGVGPLVLVGVCFLCAVLFGLRGGMATIFFSLASMGLVGAGMTTGFVEIRPDHMLTSISPMAWITFLCVFFMITSVIVIAPEVFRRGIEHSFDLIEEHRLKLEINNQRLLNEIEERKKVETALRESEERYRDLVENMGDAIYTVDMDGRISYISPVIEKMAGYRAETMVGRHFHEFFVDEEQERIVNDFNGLFSVNHGRGEYLLKTKCGEPIWVRASSRLVRNGEHPVGVQGILTDITDRKMAEQQLKTKAGELEVLNRLGREMGEDLSVEVIVNRLLEIIFAALHPDLVLFFVREGNDLLLKGCLPEESGFSEEDVPIHRVGECLCGTAARDENTVYSLDIHTDPRCTYEECKRTGFRSFVALPLKSEGQVIGVLGLASEEKRNFEASASFLQALGHEMAIGLKNGLLFEKVRADAIELQTRLVQIQDTQKEKEELMLQLHRAQKMEAIGTLAGGIAHDFNNILAPIVMGTEMALLNIPQDHKANRMLKQVLDAVARAKDLVNQILTFSRQGDFQKGPMRVAPVLKEAVKLSRAALPATIEIRQDIRTGRDTVLADPTQVHQVIVNLVTNAAHAMGAKGGILEIILDEEILDESTAGGMDTSLTPGPFLKLMVRDTGQGMDPRTLQKIFDPFFTTKRRGEGTGLGLATVNGIVRNCQGAVRVESQLGKGSLFTIYLPRLESRDKKKEKEVELIPCGTERILFVDDEPMIAEMYADMLRFLGYEVKCMTDPLETLNIFRTDSEGYDLVITDMTMPGMTGEELGREIMRIRPQTPVILCTGFTEQMPEHKALQLGFRAFVMKPVVTKEIAQKVRQALDSNREG